MILLDTQTLLWLMMDKQRLSQCAADLIREMSREQGQNVIASTTLWEIAMAATRGRIKVRGTLNDYVSQVEKSFHVLPITGAIAVRSMSFTARYPRDPADRIIGATAVVHGLRLVTADMDIRASGEVDCVW